MLQCMNMHKLLGVTQYIRGGVEHPKFEAQDSKKPEGKALDRLFEDSRSQKAKGVQVPKILHFVKVFDDNLKSCTVFEMTPDAILKFHASAAVSIYTAKQIVVKTVTKDGGNS